jgi:hypothetical protein
VTVSTYFEAVVVAASRSALVGRLKALWDAPGPDEPGPFAPIALKVYRVARGRSVVFGWRAGDRRPCCAREMEDLADELSLAFGTAVTVHYDDQVGVRAAMLSRGGEPVRHFGEADEVWVPYGEDGEVLTGGPRYPGNAVPQDVECDCIRNGIDAALEAAGFGKWLTARKLAADAAYSAFREGPPWWQRPGVCE